jgi:hypothetical protein
MKTTMVACIVLATTIAGARDVAAQPRPEDVLRRIFPGTSSTPPTQEDSRSRLDQQQPPTRAPAPKGPAALVEALADAPGAGVEPYDYLDVGAALALGARGRATIAYLDSCRVEQIRGGTVTIGDGQSSLAGGQLVSARTVACRGNRAAIGTAAREAGGGVNRVTPFPAERWAEHVVRHDRPIFKWTAPAGASRQSSYRVALIDMDQQPPRVIWSGEARGTHLAYPPRAPRLEPGVPYAVKVEAPGGSATESMFAIDPYLDVADTPANRVVPVGR